MSYSKGVAVVTGASSGIGVAYAERLAARGYDLVLVARREDRLREVADRIGKTADRKVEILIADLAQTSDLERVEARLSNDDIQILVNNAGLGALGPAAKVSADALDRLIKINVQSLTRLTRAVLPGFLARNSGIVVNIASMIAVMPTPSGAGYSGSKAYVLNFSRSLQMELAKTGVIVQAVLPGPVRTEFFEASGMTAAPFPDELFMSADQLADAALAALDQGELVCLPSLQDLSLWDTYEAARVALSRALMQSGQPARRYSAMVDAGGPR
ncbi:SDR family oxidoreductase [Tardiphaga sp. 42S5]|uniref:SDR family NAD(P)-dependent oxidoreductase n=1 Tax=Tardiphaga sp. 42S5 TaxID=1404799 RepID=UPI002A5AFE0D|nr:SDR family oxidoreductase [Tardiphaga sp. 42S5]WPO43979.1 SDR family oxidoreductase [Tardiphaga sp. 42S5]